MLRLSEALAVNAVAFYGLTRDDWSLATLLVVYWGENLMNTVFVGGRILLHRVLTRKRGHWTVPRTTTFTTEINGKVTKHAAGEPTTLLADFVRTNLIFTLTHGIFVFGFVFGVLDLGPSGPSVRYGLLAMLTAQAIGFAVDAATIRERSFVWIRRRADAAQGRMLVLHLGLIGGAFVLVWTERPPSFFVVFVVLKLLYDLASAAPWKQELPERPPGARSALGRTANKPGVADVWKNEVDAQRRKQTEDEEPMPA